MRLSVLDKLLIIFDEFATNVPLCGRTLVGTPRKIETVELNNGLFSYFGIKNQIIRIINNLPCDQRSNLPKKITIDINIDGLPVYKSNGTAMWPILGLCELNVNPFVIGIFTGSGKPDPLEKYLEQFIKEVNDLSTSGFSLQNNKLTVEIDSFLCDAPGRSYVKCCKGHGGKAGCEKCTVEGKRINNVQVFKDTNAPERTDESFSKQKDPKHHLGISPLLLIIGLGLVSCFVLDPMHLICLGVMKRLFIKWIFKGKPPYKLCFAKIQELSAAILSLASFIPSEFARIPRCVREVKRWKATEFRLFLLYLGPVVLKKVLASPIYKHFMLLHTSIFILSSKNLISKYLDFADELLKIFVKHSEKIYGISFMVYNVHNLIHICNEIRRHKQDLWAKTCFPFENFLGKLKKMIRGPALPHQQICRRIFELYNQTFTTPSRPFEKKRIGSHKKGPVPKNFEGLDQYRKLKTEKFTISTEEKDGHFQMSNGDIVRVRNILHEKESDEYFLVINTYSSVDDLYSYPCRSSKLGVFEVKNLNKYFQVFRINEIKTKLVALPTKEGVRAVFPLLHFN